MKRKEQRRLRNHSEAQVPIMLSNVGKLPENSFSNDTFVQLYLMPMLKKRLVILGLSSTLNIHVLTRHMKREKKKKKKPMIPINGTVSWLQGCSVSSSQAATILKLVLIETMGGGANSTRCSPCSRCCCMRCEDYSRNLRWRNGLRRHD